MGKIILRLGVLAWFLQSFLTSSAVAFPAPQTCYDPITGKWYIQAAGVNATSGDWNRGAQGVLGQNPVTSVDMNGVIERSWVSTAWINNQPAADSIEVGWRSRLGTTGAQYWQFIGRWWIGSYEEVFNLLTDSGHRYEFLVKKMTDDRHWKFRVKDLTTGQIRYVETWYLPSPGIPQGIPGAQQERHNSCLHGLGGTDWSALSRWNGTVWKDFAKIGDWCSDMAGCPYDPDYKINLYQPNRFTATKK